MRSPPVDRLPRRFLVVAVNAARAGTLALLSSAVWLDAAQLWVVYAALFLWGTGETLVDIAYAPAGPVTSAYRLADLGGAALVALSGGLLARTFGLLTPFWVACAAWWGRWSITCASHWSTPAGGQPGKAVLGTRLRQSEKLHERTTENTTSTQQAPSSGFLHRDGSYGVLGINDHLVQLRIPDPDYILIFCVVAAPAGGESVVIDGYRLIDRLRSSAPELTNSSRPFDVDFTSRNTNPAFPRTPRLCRIRVSAARDQRYVLLESPFILGSPLAVNGLEAMAWELAP